MCVCVSARARAWLRVYLCIHRETDLQTDGRTDGRTDGQMDRQADCQTDWQTDRDRQTDRQTDTNSHRHIHTVHLLTVKYFRKYALMILNYEIISVCTFKHNMLTKTCLLILFLCPLPLQIETIRAFIFRSIWVWHSIWDLMHGAQWSAPGLQ